MIELRWVERAVPDSTATYVIDGNAVEFKSVRKERVLQYRESPGFGPLPEGCARNWSEWRDVPTEVETLSDESAAPSDHHDPQKTGATE